MTQHHGEEKFKICEFMNITFKMPENYSRECLLILQDKTDRLLQINLLTFLPTIFHTSSSQTTRHNKSFAYYIRLSYSLQTAKPSLNMPDWGDLVSLDLLDEDDGP